jgi:hypothetical protein
VAVGQGELVSTPPIIELVDVCERLAARNRAVFELVGGWIADEPDPSVQRWLSAGAHRHAWHAELWSERRPAVPVDPVDPVDDTARLTGPGPDADRASWYLGQIAELIVEVESLAGRVDRELDDATARVCGLVAADLGELRDSAPTA